MRRPTTRTNDFNIKVKCIRTYDNGKGFIEGKVYPCCNDLGDGYWYARREDQDSDRWVFINHDTKESVQEFFNAFFVVVDEDASDPIADYERAMRGI